VNEKLEVGYSELGPLEILRLDFFPSDIANLPCKITDLISSNSSTQIYVPSLYIVGADLFKIRYGIIN